MSFTHLYLVKEVLNRLFLLSADTEHTLTDFADIPDKSWFLAIHSNGSIDTGYLYLKSNNDTVLVINIANADFYFTKVNALAPCIMLKYMEMEFVETTHECHENCNHLESKSIPLDMSQEDLLDLELSVEETPELL